MRDQKEPGPKVKVERPKRRTMALRKVRRRESLVKAKAELKEKGLPRNRLRSLWQAWMARIREA